MVAGTLTAPTAKAKSIPREPAPGEVVWFMPQGSEQDRHLFIVRDAWGDGMISGFYWENPKPQVTHSIRHTDDPHLLEHHDTRIKEGAWDFHDVWRLNFDFVAQQEAKRKAKEQ